MNLGEKETILTACVGSAGAEVSAARVFSAIYLVEEGLDEIDELTPPIRAKVYEMLAALLARRAKTGGL